MQKRKFRLLLLLYDDMLKTVCLISSITNILNNKSACEKECKFEKLTKGHLSTDVFWITLYIGDRSDWNTPISNGPPKMCAKTKSVSFAFKPLFLLNMLYICKYTGARNKLARVH